MKEKTNKYIALDINLFNPARYFQLLVANTHTHSISRGQSKFSHDLKLNFQIFPIRGRVQMAMKLRIQKSSHQTKFGTLTREGVCKKKFAIGQKPNIPHPHI